MRTIESPATESTVKNMKLGEIVRIHGNVITGRDEMHMRALALSNSKDAPSCLFGATLFHCGPIMIDNGNGWTVIAAGPTTSARMNSLEPEMIERFGIKVIVGKGGMSKPTLDAMKKFGCVYLAAIGGAAVSLAEGLRKVTGVEWTDLGMAEAMWQFEADNFGPLIVAMDAHGNSLYDDVEKKIRQNPRVSKYL